MEKSWSFATNAEMQAEINRIFANNGLQNVAVFTYDTVDSTNTRAKLFAKSCGAGLTPAIFISRAQSAGRGTRARSFESPLGAGLYMSILLPAHLVPENPAHLTSYTAVAVSRAIEGVTCGAVKPLIKWVNDLVVADKKLGGILTEASFCDNGEAFYVVGIGINLCPAPHSDEVSAIMTTLADLGAPVSYTDFLCAVASEFFSSVSEYGSDRVTAEYRALSSLIGRQVILSGTEDGCIATVTDIDNDRAIVLRKDDGTLKKYVSGDVSIRPKGE